MHPQVYTLWKYLLNTCLWLNNPQNIPIMNMNLPFHFFFCLQEGRAGYTPLHIAVSYNHVQMVEFLLKECRQINVEALTWGRLTAYQLAASLGQRAEIMNLLEQFGCNRLSPPPSDYSDDSEDSDDSYEL